jgi:hypothetical protein
MGYASFCVLMLLIIWQKCKYYEEKCRSFIHWSRTKYRENLVGVVSCEQNAEHNHTVKRANKFFEYMVKFTHLG